MGYIAHHAIVVTGWQDQAVLAAHIKAAEAGCLITPIVRTRVNGYTSFAVLPDGSKEGWNDSDLGDEARTALLDWIDSDPKLYLDYVEVRFGGDEPSQTQITRRSEEHA